MLIFHNVTEVNENGNIVKIDNSMAKSLYSILTSVNANVQKHFSINPPTIVNLPQITNFSERKKYYLSKLNVLQQKYKLSVNSTLQDYNDAYWENLIKTKAMSFNYNIPKELLNLLITRWSRFDTSASLNKIKAICDNPEFFNWIKEFDKRDHYAEFKRNAYDW